MKLTNEICISFLRGSGWLYNHDKEITISERNKAIDDFVKEICKMIVQSENNGNYRFYAVEIKQAIAELAEQLKAGGENEYGSGKICGLSD